MIHQEQIAAWRVLESKGRHPDDWSWEYVDSIYQYQYRYNSVYRSWVDGLGRYSDKIQSLSDLTFLPIQFFKSNEVYCAPTSPEVEFQSSGTTGQVRSRHGISRLSEYHRRCMACFEEAYGHLGSFRHLFFLPFYSSNPHSSLISMAEFFIQSTLDKGSRFIGGINDVEQVLRESEAATVLWTVTFGAMDILDLDLDLTHPRLIFIETGGSKGQRKVLPRKDLHSRLKELGHNLEVGSEYGMCELSSQCYFQKGRFKMPSGFRVISSEIDDPLNYDIGEGGRGRVCIIDLANRHSCAFIETEDVGRTWQDGSFVLEGRLDHAELRGCNLMYTKDDLLN